MISGQYSDEEMLQLSGIQHYAFCPRQWALIHIEQLWDNNSLTAEGTLLHQNVDNPFVRETDGSGIITLRRVRIASHNLGLSGIADAIQLRPHKGAPRQKASLLKSRMFELIPIEYKRGHRKVNDCDRMQVSAQAMILEEMLGISISRGAIFYWEQRHREYFDVDFRLRSAVMEAVAEMHKLVETKILPESPQKGYCKSCSLFDSCLPSISLKSAQDYLDNTLSEIKKDNEETS